MATPPCCDPSCNERNRARYRRRRAAIWSPGPIAILAVAAIVAASTGEWPAAVPTPVDAFATTFRPPPPPPVQPQLLSPALGAVHKRSGNHNPSSRGAAAIAASRRRQRKANVFEQFTPEYSISPFDVDLSPANGHVNGQDENGVAPKSGAAPKNGASKKNGVDKSQIRKGNKVNLRLRSLLKDDTGEQEMEMYPDHSLEAAEQVADRRSYSKLSEEARRKANLAVSADDESEGEEVGAGRAVDKKGKGPRATVEEEEATSNMVTLASTSSRVVRAPPRRRVRATVKETGSDSISTYVKSLGQHELLHQADEVLLGRQVRILMGLEDKRQELEEELLRAPTFAQWAVATNHTVLLVWRRHT